MKEVFRSITILFLLFAALVLPISCCHEDPEPEPEPVPEPVPVVVNVTGISLDKSVLTLTEGSSETLTVKLTPENATDKSMTLTSSDKSVASVDQGGKVTAVSPGEALIIASTHDGGFIALCEVTVMAKTVSVDNITLSESILGLTQGKEVQLKAVVGPDDATDKTVSWSSSDETVAIVDSDGKVTAVGPGTAVITATTKDGEKNATCEVTVSLSVESLSLSETTLELKKYDEIKFSAKVGPENATDTYVEWSSSDESVVTVDGDGKVTAVGPGTATITAKTRDGGITASCEIIVTVPVDSIILDVTSLDLILGEEATLTATVGPEDASDKSIEWSSSDETVAIVDSNGKVTAVGPGIATITAKTKDGGMTASCEIVVTVPVDSVTLDVDILDLTVGEEATLTATVGPENATDKRITWSSSDESVVIVDEDGKVTAVGPGTATITVTTNDGGKTATCEVTVSSDYIHISGVSLNRSSMTIYVGETRRLIVRIEPENSTSKEVVWTSSASNIAKVDKSGYVTGVKVGTAKITVTTEDGGKVATCDVTVIEKPAVGVTSVKLNKTSLTMTEGDKEKLIATVSPSNATDKRVTWSSSGNAVSVDANGNVTAVKAGTAVVTVTTVSGNASATCDVIVNARIPVTGVGVDPFVKLGEPVGSKFKITATVRPSNATDKSVTWKSSNENVAIVDQEGNVTTVGNGTVTITVTTNDGGYTANFYMSVH